MYSPLEQFEIIPLIPVRRGGRDLSFTNSSLRRVLGVRVLVGLSARIARSASQPTVGKDGEVSLGGGRLVPSRWQTILEGIYGVVQSRLTPLGVAGQPYFPWLFTIFSFILILNLRGLVPYSFTATSHIIVTLTLTGRVWIGKLIVGVRLHGVKLLGRFLPGGAPLVRAPRLVPLELIGFLVTLVSLSVRLFANRRAGHILLKVFGGFAWSRRRAGGLIWVAHFLPLVTLFLLLFLETGVARVQAYVFSLLTARYIGDRLSGGH